MAGTRASGGGRKRKPTIQHILNGNPSRMNLEKERSNEPIFEQPDQVPKPLKSMKAPHKPKLTGDEQQDAKDFLQWKNEKKLCKLATDEWKRIAPGLHEQGLLTEMGLRCLEMLCNSLARYVDAGIHIKRYGVVMNKADWPVASPYLAIQNQASKEIRQCMTEFGMTPSSASRVTAKPIKKKNTVANFLERAAKLHRVK